MAASKKTAKVPAKSAKKSAKVAKSATKVATKTTRPEWMGKPGTEGCDVDGAIKLMQRKQGCTRSDLNDADFRQPAMSAINTAENRGLKFKIEKPEGEYKIYRVFGGVSGRK